MSRKVNAEVFRREGETIDKMLARFRREVKKAKLPNADVFYESKGGKRKHREKRQRLNRGL